MLRDLTTEEYITLRAYYSIVPFPEDRADNRASIISFYTSRQYTKESFDKFVIDYLKEPKPKQTVEEIAFNAKLINASVNKNRKGE